MTTTDLNEYLPRLEALRDKLNDSVNVEFSLWLHDHSKHGGKRRMPPTYNWSVWDGKTHHYGATLGDALTVAEHANEMGQGEPVDVLVIPERAVYDENA